MASGCIKSLLGYKPVCPGGGNDTGLSQAPTVPEGVSAMLGLPATRPKAPAAGALAYAFQVGPRQSTKDIGLHRSAGSVAPYAEESSTKGFHAKAIRLRTAFSHAFIAASSDGPPLSSRPLSSPLVAPSSTGASRSTPRDRDYGPALTRRGFRGERRSRIVDRFGVAR